MKTSTQIWYSCYLTGQLRHTAIASYWKNQNLWTRHENIQLKVNQTSNLSLYLPQGSFCEMRSYAYFPSPMDSNFCMHQQWITYEKTSIPGGELYSTIPASRSNVTQIRMTSKLAQKHQMHTSLDKIGTESAPTRCAETRVTVTGCAGNPSWVTITYTIIPMSNFLCTRKAFINTLYNVAESKVA